MTRQQLIARIRNTGSYLCVGLDSEKAKLPRHLLSHPDAGDIVYEFNRQIIDATKDYCVAYKINTAFYEADGVKGWETLERTVNYIPSTHFKIADAKRGDIGNTSSQYARAFFETLNFDAVTVAPYMGEDSVKPFLEYKDKWTILLGLTSNPGSRDFELQPAGNGLLYEKVLTTAAGWGSPDNLMYVVGATQAAEFTRIRSLTPDHFYLVPGVGAQGGSLEAISRNAMNKDVGLLVNASRAVIYASAGEDFAQAAGSVAAEYHREMQQYLTILR
ncbi:orotidine-5'-phosphate decarboxylase [Puia dinghuensis]|uniref:Orotidine-5'-phosphate decarboxylase n=1 Tax=Puia dinghuensis TaxID=1792502 RepID=A0A8J2XVW5_9BACT|nr:orotidine-5'-phosphate decarboxylase [Puia dinghuensis]GGB21619.1 orotidine 5'-phosphate decarboxylase [Puia dinghuensis]